jgi:CheY-like chemotaxis protein
MKRMLTSVKMPIRDGYSATHAIRTEAPWRDRPEIRSVPIVAMTASAIQGDKEKCTLAGMDVSTQITNPYFDGIRILTTVGLFVEACQRQNLREGQFLSPHTASRLTFSDACQVGS